MSFSLPINVPLIFTIDALWGSAIWWLQKPVIMLEGFDKLILRLLSEVLPIFFYRLIMFLLCKDNSAGFLWYCCAVVNTIVLLYSTKSKFRVYEILLIAYQFAMVKILINVFHRSLILENNLSSSPPRLSSLNRKCFKIICPFKM